MPATLPHPLCVLPMSSGAPASNRVTFVVFSGELDRLQAAFTLATGASACGMDVTMFFTFWGVSLLRTQPTTQAKSLVDRLFGWMLPGGADRAPLSRIHMGGIGRLMMQRQMRRKGIPSLADLVAIARESGIRFGICESTMQMMGIDRSELLPGVEFEVCGVAHVWDQAAGGQVLFI